VRLQDTKTIIQSNKQQRFKIEEYIFLLKIYKAIAKIDNNKTKKLKELCNKRQQHNKDTKNIVVVV